MGTLLPKPCSEYSCRSCLIFESLLCTQPPTRIVHFHYSDSIVYGINWKKSLFLELKFSYHLTLPCGNNLISQGSSLCPRPTVLFRPLIFCSEWFLFLFAKLLASPNIPCLFIAVSSYPASSYLFFFFLTLAVFLTSLYSSERHILGLWLILSHSLCSAHSRWSRNVYWKVLNQLNVFSIPAVNQMHAH